jgi:hypothetical protein
MIKDFENNGMSDDDAFEVGPDNCGKFYWTHPDCGQVWEFRYYFFYFLFPTNLNKEIILIGL